MNLSEEYKNKLKDILMSGYDDNKSIEEIFEELKILRENYIEEIEERKKVGQKIIGYDKNTFEPNYE